MQENNNSIYNEEEQELLELTKKLRVDTLKKMVENGVPVRSGDIRVLNELATSLDKTVIDTANARIKNQDSQNNKANAELIVAAIMSKRSDTNIVIDNRIDALPDDVVELEIVPGQTDINPGQLNPSDFIQNDED